MSTKTIHEEYQEGKDYSQKVEETGREFSINWMGVLKYTVIAGVVAGAYYVGKKQGAKAEALKHVSTEVQPVAQETSEI